MPIDFSASVVHKIQRESTVSQIVVSPHTASTVESPANCTGDNPLLCAIGKLASEFGRANMVSGSLNDEIYLQPKFIAKELLERTNVIAADA
jgi:hypothetical protein